MISYRFFIEKKIIEKTCFANGFLSKWVRKYALGVVLEGLRFWGFSGGWGFFFP